MRSSVFFTNIRTGYKRNLFDKTKELCLRSGIRNIVAENDLVAIKLHFGEQGNLAYVYPPLIRTIVELIKEYKGKPFLTDTNTLYSGSRRNAVDHITTAIKNGFSYSVVECPVIIADGLLGTDGVPVKISGKHFKEVKISSAIYHSDAFISIAHFKFHEGTGFGGTLKNIGMGCATPSGKQRMHSDVLPKINKNRCTGCRSCIEWCPVSAINIKDKKSEIDKRVCIGCAECITICKYQALEISWKTDKSYLQEKMVEYTLGVLKNKKDKYLFFNFVINVSPDCDCPPWNDAPVVPDIGILSSSDPVAIDQASVDLVNSSIGLINTRLKDIYSKDKIFDVTGITWHYQLEYAEKIGLGKRKYELIEI